MLTESICAKDMPVLVNASEGVCIKRKIMGIAKFFVYLLGFEVFKAFA